MTYSSITYQFTNVACAFVIQTEITSLQSVVSKICKSFNSCNKLHVQVTQVNQTKSLYQHKTVSPARQHQLVVSQKQTHYDISASTL